MKSRSIFLCALLAVSSGIPQAHAHGGNIACLAVLARSKTPTETFKHFLKEKYPALSIVLADPDAFLVRMRARFDAQRRIDPERAYFFDYSELGMPLVENIDRYITRKMGELTAPGKIPATESERKIALEYLTALQKEARNILSRGTVTYRELIEFSYFYSRAVGHFDTRSFRVIDRNFLPVDRSLEGYRQLSIAGEYDLYLKRNFSVFQMKTSSAGYNAAADSFAKAFDDPTELKSLWVPTDTALERDVFMRMMFKDIHFVGVTYESILADGFLRPGGDFWMHDVRYESAKYFEKYAYIKKHRLGEDGIRKMSAQIDAWALELASANLKVRDHELQEAINHIAFNFHHDRGFPLIPSVFLSREKTFVAHALYSAMVVGGQGIPFYQPIKNFQKASAWLEKFWQRRLPQEEAITGATP